MTIASSRGSGEPKDMRGCRARGLQPRESPGEEGGQERWAASPGKAGFPLQKIVNGGEAGGGKILTSSWQTAFRHLSLFHYFWRQIASECRRGWSLRLRATAFQCQAVIAQRRPTVHRVGGGAGENQSVGYKKGHQRWNAGGKATDTVEWLADNAGSQN